MVQYLLTAFFVLVVKLLTLLFRVVLALSVRLCV